MRERHVAVAAALLLAGLASGCSTLRSPSPGESVTFEAPALAANGHYRVILPPSYASTKTRYPVLYFLHDVLGNENLLWRQGIAQEIYRLMRSGELPEFVLVAPRGSGSFYTNFYDGSKLYEDFVFHDLLRDAESRYRCGGSREMRAISGISMGGYGALKIALKHPRIYGSASSLSGAVQPYDWQHFKDSSWLIRWSMRRVFGKKEDANNLAENDLGNIAAANPALRETAPRLHLRAGTEDRWDLDRYAEYLARDLRKRGIETEVTLEPGVHDWEYWRFATIQLLRWHAAAWNRGGA